MRRGRVAGRAGQHARVEAERKEAALDAAQRGLVLLGRERDELLAADGPAVALVGGERADAVAVAAGVVRLGGARAEDGGCIGEQPDFVPLETCCGVAVRWICACALHR